MFISIGASEALIYHFNIFNNAVDDANSANKSYCFDKNILKHHPKQ